MKIRLIAVLLILLLLLVPGITGVFASPDSDQSSETSAPEAPETEGPAAEDPVETETPNPEPETEAVEPQEPEPETAVPTESEEPTSPEESEEPSEPVIPQEFSEFVLDREPTETEPGREESHGLIDAAVVRYRYYWIVRLHTADEAVSEIKAYLHTSDGSTVFESERTVETEAAIELPQDPTRSHASFSGWYTDAECSAANAFHLTSQTVITSHLDLYAKWNEENGSITIRRKLDEGEEQSFLYTVHGSDGSEIQVTIPAGKNTVTVCGARYGVTYAITEEQSWSWRFDCEESKYVTLSEKEPTATVTFAGNKTVKKWLGAIAELSRIVSEG